MSSPATSSPAVPCEAWAIPDVGHAHEARSRELDEVRRKAREEGFEAGREAGHAAGHRAGHERAMEEFGPYAGQLRAILVSLGESLETLDEDVEHALVALATGVARQIVFESIAASPELVLVAIREARAALPMATRALLVSVHPDDAVIVRRALEIGGPLEWTIREDTAITRGGCRVETETSTVDATVEGRLASVIAQVLGSGERAVSGPADGVPG